MSYTVRIPIKVHEQTMEIAAYISEKLKSPQAAQNVLDDLYDAYSSLEEFPERIPLSRIRALKSRNVRCMVVRKYLIYFQIWSTYNTQNAIWGSFHVIFNAMELCF